jgi:hypothetical protein
VAHIPQADGVKTMQKIALDDNTILYKYRAFNENSLSMLINQELYFAAPKQLNDPYDCQISIRMAIESAISSNNIAEELQNEAKLRLTKLRDHLEKHNIIEKIEQDISAAGIFSLSCINDDHLMWAHYADNHRGFCLGFQVYKRLSDLKNDTIMSPVRYWPADTNPYRMLFMEYALADELMPWEELWISLFSIGFETKCKAWEYEGEVRAIRKNSGPHPFEPNELREVIFGVKMLPVHRKTIRQLLSGEEGQHVRFRKVTKKESDFKLTIIDS